MPKPLQIDLTGAQMLQANLRYYRAATAAIIQNQAIVGWLAQPDTLVEAIYSSAGRIIGWHARYRNASSYRGKTKLGAIAMAIKGGP